MTAPRAARGRSVSEALDYRAFLERKRITAELSGFDVQTVSKKLFPFQRDSYPR